MSSLSSKFEDIAKIRFEPLSSKVIKVVKLTMVDNTIVALGADGVVYSTGILKGCYYYGGYDDRMERVIDGCVKLNILSKEIVAKHKADVRERVEAINAKHTANSVLKGLFELNVPMTKLQLEKLNALASPIIKRNTVKK